MPRTFLIFALCLPVAVLMGFMLSDPLVRTNMAVTGALMLILLLPLIINFHHRLLIWSSGAILTVYFLPGQPSLWMLMALVSVGMSLISRPLSKEKPRFLWTKSLSWSVVYLTVVILGTAKLTGGFGAKALGSEVYGGKRYAALMMAFIGLAALVMQTVPRKNVKTDLALFTLAPGTAAFSNLVYMLGPSFYFLYLIFPVDMALDQAAFDLAPGLSQIRRLNGLAPASMAIVSFCLMRWGIRGMLEFKPWRQGLFLIGIAFGLASGFRSTLAIPALMCMVQFFAEGLHRTKYAMLLAGAGLASFGFLAAFSEELPLAAQRSLSFLPVRVDSAAKADADASMDWRLQMWAVVVKDVPTYFWKGKGYALDPKDLYFAEESMKRGFAEPYDFAIKAGDYHNGPLSIIIPFGIWGVIGYLWFCAESLRILWKNMRYGEASLRMANIFLFSTFAARVLFFLFFFGGFFGEMWFLSALVGLGLSINGGVAQERRNPRLEYKRAPQAVRAAQLVEA